MSPEQIALISSIIVVLILAISSFTFIQIRIRKLRRKILEINLKDNKIGMNLILKREDIGELYEDWKTKSPNALNDLYVEFTINTILRNDFKNGLYLGKTNGYEPLSFSNKTKASFKILEKDLNKQKYQELLELKKNITYKLEVIEKVSLEEQFDIIIFNDDLKNWNDLYGKYFKNLKKNGLIIIYDFSINKKTKKNFINHLKLVKAYFEEIKINNGIFLITKK
ncbi:BC85_0335 family putative methyltransferase [[Mycoplasma] mobile]|uniref:Expressed protein n=1 Tax=Mycoplasma mobile (strain ATCC 43663 / 163K / NCTC 11711) TaxID=267748 RepID=Q6KHK8_MYCM1|nr:hypothetical protein [[Mycoplasma] mobile]AAT27922.1 expressed protein [Mycoplasma mobile 163K]